MDGSIRFRARDSIGLRLLAFVVSALAVENGGVTGGSDARGSDWRE